MTSRSRSRVVIAFTLLVAALAIATGVVEVDRQQNAELRRLLTDHSTETGRIDTYAWLAERITCFRFDDDDFAVEEQLFGRVPTRDDRIFVLTTPWGGARRAWMCRLPADLEFFGLPSGIAALESGRTCFYKDGVAYPGRSEHEERERLEHVLAVRRAFLSATTLEPFLDCDVEGARYDARARMALLGWRTP
jgi:hypothetical protein